MKPVIIIVIVFVLLIPSIAFAQSSEKSLAYHVNDISTLMILSFLLWVIPVLIVLLVLRHKGKLDVSIKKILGGFVLLFLGVIVLSIISQDAMTDEEKELLAEEKREREFKSLQKSIAERQQEEGNAYQQQKEECFDINWKYHTQDIYKTMSESQYCPEFKNMLDIACSQEAKRWWKDMQVLWGC